MSVSVFLIIFSSVSKEKTFKKIYFFYRIDKYRCRSGECIDRDVVCDGNIDCIDASDEEEDVCLEIPCSRGFRCRYGACVSRKCRCDSIIDCADGSDEGAN